MRVISRLAGVQLVLAMLALVVMGGVTVVDVVLKYVLSRPVVGAYDLVESLLPVVIFHGLPATLLRRQTIVIDLVDHLAGPARTRVLVRTADLLVLGLLVLITAAMITPALQALDYGDRKLELGLPLAAVWAAAILGVAGAILVAGTLALRPPPRAADHVVPDAAVNPHEDAP